MQNNLPIHPVYFTTKWWWSEQLILLLTPPLPPSIRFGIEVELWCYFNITLQFSCFFFRERDEENYQLRAYAPRVRIIICVYIVQSNRKTLMWIFQILNIKIDKINMWQNNYSALKPSWVCVKISFLIINLLR